MQQVTKHTTGTFDVVNRQTGHVVGEVRISGGEFVSFTPAELPAVVVDGWDIAGWRQFVTDELLSNDYTYGDPPHGCDEGFASNKAIVERNPCPGCGGRVVYMSYHRRRETVGYTPLIPQWSYRVFGVCRRCDAAFEF